MSSFTGWSALDRGLFYIHIPTFLMLFVVYNMITKQANTFRKNKKNERQNRCFCQCFGDLLTFMHSIKAGRIHCCDPQGICISVTHINILMLSVVNYHSCSSQKKNKWVEKMWLNMQHFNFAIIRFFLECECFCTRNEVYCQMMWMGCRWFSVMKCWHHFVLPFLFTFS